MSAQADQNRTPSLTCVRLEYSTNTDKHGARLDVYVEEETEEETDIAYDVEADQNDGKE